MKRLIDIFVAALGLIIFSPILFVAIMLVWLYDRKMPFYIAPRAACGGGAFKILKIRTMVKDADKNGIESTSNSDTRITLLGHYLRKWKVDELTQLWNVLKGDMSLVGPRPNTLREVNKYNNFEMLLLSVKPGITDFSSIIFSDEGEILSQYNDPEEAYDKFIRPWKSELGIIYVKHASISLDVKLIFLTIVAVIYKPFALKRIELILNDLCEKKDIVDSIRRQLFNQ